MAVAPIPAARPPRPAPDPAMQQRFQQARAAAAAAPPGGMPGGGGGMSAALGAGARPMAPGGLPSMEEKQARNAAAVQRYGDNPPTRMYPGYPGEGAPPRPMGGPMGRPPMLGAGPPGMPQAARGMPPPAGAKPMAPGGAFGMKQAMGSPGPFGQMTKAPGMTGQAERFAGMGRNRGGSR